MIVKAMSRERQEVLEEFNEAAFPVLDPFDRSYCPSGHVVKKGNLNHLKLQKQMLSTLRDFLTKSPEDFVLCNFA